MEIRKARKVDYHGRPVLFLEIDGVPGHVLDEQKRLRQGIAIISGEAARLFPPMRIPFPTGVVATVPQGATDDPMLVRLVWDFVLSNIAEGSRYLLGKPPQAVQDVAIDKAWFQR